MLGPDAGGLSASTVARLTEVWADEHAHWLKRDLSARHYVYFWADGIHVQARLEDDAQCLLVIIGATPEGKKELVGLIDGVRESAQSWRELLLDLKRRGLAVAPDLAIADGALGFWKAIEEVDWPRTRSQLICWVHKDRPTMLDDKLPKSQLLEGKACSPGNLDGRDQERSGRQRRRSCLREFETLRSVKYVTRSARPDLVKDRATMTGVLRLSRRALRSICAPLNPIENRTAAPPCDDRYRAIQAAMPGLLNKTGSISSMVFKLAQAAQNSWRHYPDGHNQCAQADRRRLRSSTESKPSGNNRASRPPDAETVTKHSAR